ncbi:MAG: hypothetical protein ACO1N5_08870 [Noviherbaspirillum sp.]
MAVMLVTYDLYQPGQNYPRLIKAIQTYPWARLSDTSYAIATSDSPAAVLEHLRPYVSDATNLYVLSLRKPYAGYGPEAVNDWLEESHRAG